MQTNRDEPQVPILILHIRCSKENTNNIIKFSQSEICADLISN